MRVTCIYSCSSDAIHRFLDSMLDIHDAEKRRSIRTLVFPPENPMVAAVIDDAANPAVQWASSPNGSFAIVDGEIYNKAELSEAASTLSNNDAEAVLDHYLKSGQEVISQLDAAASIVVWDATEEMLLLFRDRSGIVPSYYAEQPDSILVASHIGTLLSVGVSPDINLPALDLFLGNGSIPAPWTFVEQIEKIPAAHVLSVSQGGSSSLRRYWQATGSPELRLSTNETTKHLGNLFEKSLRRRWSPDTKNGVLLSSGVDSKLIVAGFKKWLGASIDTFTFRYTDYYGQFNEVDEARRAAEYFGTQHYEIDFRPTDIVDNLEWMLRSYGEPFTYGLHSCMLRDVMKAGVSVLLTGAGAGSVYLGKSEFDALRYAQLPSVLQKLGQTSIPLLWRLNAQSRPMGLWRVYGAAGDLAYEAENIIQCARSGLPTCLNGTILPEKYRTPFFSDTSWVPKARHAQVELFNSVAQDYAEESAHDKMTCLERHCWTAEASLHWNHWWGRAYGLTMRFPYFDSDWCEFVMRLPRKTPNKDDFRQLAASLMPHDMAYVPKIYQAVPISYWFRGALKDFLCDQLSSKRIKESGLFNNTVVQECIKQHISGKNDHGWKLWAILTVLVWQDLVSRCEL